MRVAQQAVARDGRCDTAGALAGAPGGQRWDSAARRALASPISVSVFMSPGLLSSRHDTSEDIGARLIRNQLDRPEEFSFMSSNCPFDSPAVLVCNCEWTFIHSFIHLELSDRGRLRATATSQCIFRLPWRDTTLMHVGWKGTRLVTYVRHLFSRHSAPAP